MIRTKAQDTIEILIRQRDYSALLDYGLNAYDMGEQALTPDQRYAILMLVEVLVEEAERLGKVRVTRNIIDLLESGLDTIA